MSNISSDTLFHFTNFEGLKGILKKGFYPRYSLEKIEPRKDCNLEAAWPMVCFCDIPLSQVKQHQKIYGKYGIGMSKEWANKQKLNPVMYLSAGSNLSDKVYKISASVASDSNKKELVTFMIYHVKSFEGQNKEGTVVKFYNEREWRYVPCCVQDEEDVERIWPESLSKKEYGQSQLLEKKNKGMEAFKLGFHPKDIRYIIVKNENEILKMVDFLTEVKTEELQYDKKIVKILTSRIITSEQIQNDF